MSNIKWDSKFYDAKHDFVSAYGEDLLRILSPMKGESILDLGCGTGQLSAIMSEKGAEITGIDSSPDMIATAIENYPGINFEVKDAVDFHFEAPFDAVFSNAVLHWIEEKEKVVECMYRCLKPGGRLVVEFGGKGNMATMINALRETLDRLALKSKDDFKVHWYFPSIGAYCSLLEKQGFHVKYAAHFDRPTELKTEDGIKDWFRMFGERFFEGISQKDVERALEETQNSVRDSLYEGGKWFADYKRLRIIAVKP